MESTVNERLINNKFYDRLGERWYGAWDDPIALLRAENKLKLQWVQERLVENLMHGDTDVLDVGCGAGFLSNALAETGMKVTGLDISSESLEVARSHDATRGVRYVQGDARELPFEGAHFDVVTCMDFLEHVSDPARVIAEIGRVLRPGGLLFFHTFSRNPLSWLMVVKGVEWFVRNTPPRMHVHSMFIRPQEIEGYCRRADLECLAWTGLRPKVFSKPFWKLLRTGVVPPDFEFEFTSSRVLSYLGMARKLSPSPA